MLLLLTDIACPRNYNGDLVTKLMIQRPYQDECSRYECIYCPNNGGAYQSDGLCSGLKSGTQPKVVAAGATGKAVTVKGP